MGMYVAKADTDSSNGYVDCTIAGVTITIPTTFYCQQGDNLQIQIENHKCMVIGVIGRGDQMQESILTLQSNQDFIALMTDVNIWDNEPENELQYSQAAIIAKRYFDEGKWSISRINMLLNAGKITQEEYVWIVGENPKG